MKETGIIRRMDELGRFVIPKEIRAKLRIKTGDPIEIYTEGEQMILKKYSPMTEISALAQTVAQELSKIVEKPCVITDTNTVIAVSDGKLKGLINKEITAGVNKAINERKSLIISRSDGGIIIPIVKESDLEIENQVVVPITTNGDGFGTVFLLDFDKYARFTMNEVKLIRLGANFIASQFES